MNVLIVHAHYESKSFTSALKDAAVTVLVEQGHQVVVSDLYAMGFDPVAKKSDFASPKNGEYTNYSLEQRHGWETGTIAPDIAAEVAKLLAADLLILSFPVFWFSVPAILKGWIDRVLLSGVCFGGRRFYDRGGLRGKRALMAATMGGRSHMFGEGAIHGPFEALFSPLLRGTLGYVGFDILAPFIAWHVPYITNEARRAILEGYRTRLANISTETPLDVYPSLNDFDSIMRPIASAPPSPGGS